MIALDSLPGKTALTRAQEIFRLKRQLIEIRGAIHQIDAGYPVVASVGQVHCRLTAEGREEITAAYYRDLIRNQRETELALADMGVDLDKEIGL